MRLTDALRLFASLIAFALTGGAMAQRDATDRSAVGGDGRIRVDRVALAARVHLEVEVR